MKIIVCVNVFPKILSNRILQNPWQNHEINLLYHYCQLVRDTHLKKLIAFLLNVLQNWHIIFAKSCDMSHYHQYNIQYQSHHIGNGQTFSIKQIGIQKYNQPNSKDNGFDQYFNQLVIWQIIFIKTTYVIKIQDTRINVSQEILKDQLWHYRLYKLVNMTVK